MKIDKEYKFPVSISKEAFTDKVIANAMIGENSKENKETRKQYGFKSIHYYRKEVNPEELLNYLLDGHCVCHLYRSDKDFFYKSDKVFKNFEGAYCICVDIDKTKEDSVESYISKLPKKPTIYYTSYSHMKEGKGVRFRMIYVFSKLIKNHYIFRYFCKCLNDMIESSVEPIEDKCNLISSQYFNGTHRSANPEFGITNYIYDFDDFDINGQGCINYLIRYCDYKTPDKTHKENIAEILYKILHKRYVFNTPTMSFVEVPEILSTTKIEDCTPIQRTCSGWLKKELMTRGFNSVAKRFKLFYRTESDNWIDDKYQYIDDSFICLPYYEYKRRNGQHRRKEILKRACVRRIIKPDATADDLLVNAAWDVTNMFDNSDGVLTIDCLVHNVESAMSMSIEEIWCYYGKYIDKLKKERTPKSKIILKGEIKNKQTTRKNVLYEKYNEVYDRTKTDKENVEIIKERLGLDVSIETIKRFRKEYGIIKYKKNKSVITDYILKQENTESVITDYLVKYKENDISITESESVNTDYLVKGKENDSINKETTSDKEMNDTTDNWIQNVCKAILSDPFYDKYIEKARKELESKMVIETTSKHYAEQSIQATDVKPDKQNINLTLKDLTSDFFRR